MHQPPHPRERATHRLPAARAVFGAGIGCATLAFLIGFGFSSGHRSDSTVILVWLLAYLPLLLAAHAPAWFLLRRLATETDPSRRLRLFVATEVPLAAIAIAGLVILAGSWDKLHLFWIPTLPSMFAIAWVAAASDEPAAEQQADQ